MPSKHYKVFVSSTFADLEPERRLVMNAILDDGNMPSGMELFPAANRAQFDLIKRIIDDCDYYVLITAGKYGTLEPSGKKSYTHLEYEYALAKGIPVLGFLYKDISELPLGKSETSTSGRRRLKEFHEHVKTKMCRMWTNGEELARMVITSLHGAIVSDPRPGWMRSGTLLGNYTRQEAEIPGWHQACERLEANDYPWVGTPEEMSLCRPSISPKAFYIWNDAAILAPAVISLTVTFTHTTIADPRLPDFRIALFGTSPETTYNSAPHVVCIAPWEGGPDRIDILHYNQVATRATDVSRLIALDVPYHYKLELRGDNMELFVNGNTVLAAKYADLFMNPVGPTSTPWYWGLSTVGRSIRVSGIHVERVGGL